MFSGLIAEDHARPPTPTSTLHTRQDTHTRAHPGRYGSACTRGIISAPPSLSNLSPRAPPPLLFSLPPPPSAAHPSYRIPSPKRQRAPSPPAAPPRPPHPPLAPSAQRPAWTWWRPFRPSCSSWRKPWTLRGRQQPRWRRSRGRPRARARVRARRRARAAEGWAGRPRWDRQTGRWRRRRGQRRRQGQQGRAMSGWWGTGHVESDLFWGRGSGGREGGLARSPLSPSLSRLPYWKEGRRRRGRGRGRGRAIWLLWRLRRRRA